MINREKVFHLAHQREGGKASWELKNDTQP